MVPVQVHISASTSVRWSCGAAALKDETKQSNSELISVMRFMWNMRNLLLLILIFFRFLIVGTSLSLIRTADQSPQQLISVQLQTAGTL